MDNLVAIVVMGEAYEGYEIKGVYENFNGAIKEAGKLAEAEGMSFVDGSERTLSPRWESASAVRYIKIELHEIQF